MMIGQLTPEHHPGVDFMGIHHQKVFFRYRGKTTESRIPCGIVHNIIHNPANPSFPVSLVNHTPDKTLFVDQAAQEKITNQLTTVKHCHHQKRRIPEHPPQ